MRRREYSVTVDLLRHGEVEGGECLRGRTDHALTTTGWKQLRQATHIRHNWTGIVSSPLQRCAEFARALSGEFDIPLIIEPDFQEIDFGDWDGYSFEKLHREQPIALSRFWENPYLCTPPEGEPIKQFNLRIQKAWNRLIQQSPGQHILLITHGGVIRQVLAYILGIPENNPASVQRISLPYASQCRIEVYVDSNGQHWPRLMFSEPDQNNSDV